MKETNKNKIKTGIGYNPCPRCGSQAYAITTDDDMHRVGCLYCGFINGVENYIGDCNGEELMELLRKEWNKHCLADLLSEQFFKAWGTYGQGYVLAQRTDGYIINITDDFSDIISFAITHENEVCNIYEIVDGELSEIGSTYLVRLIVNHKTIR